MIPQLILRRSKVEQGVGEGKEKMKRAALQLSRERESQQERQAQRALGQEDPGSVTGRHHFVHACRSQGGPGATRSKVKSYQSALNM